MWEVCDQAEGVDDDDDLSVEAGGSVGFESFDGETDEAASAFLSSDTTAGGMIGGTAFGFWFVMGVISSLASPPIFPLSFPSPAFISAPYSSTISAALP